MIYYKNIFLNISNSLNSRRVSTVQNPHADIDAHVLARACQSAKPIIATNGNSYYYFIDNYMEPKMVQYLLNVNGVLAYRRYSGYQVFYTGRKPVVRVPVEYLDSNPQAKAFINKIINLRFKTMDIAEIDISQYIAAVQQRMRGK